MARFSVVYDACVLYPAPLRDLLMRLAVADLFRARWTEQIHQEWIQSLLRKGSHTESPLNRVKELMDSHVRDAKVTGYEYLIESMTLPDPNDRHVLAAAIHCHADAILTFNLKDFPTHILERYALEAIHPDDFLCYQMDLSLDRVCSALKKQRAALKNPPITAEELLSHLQKQQLPQTCAILYRYIDLL